MLDQHEEKQNPPQTQEKIERSKEDTKQHTLNSDDGNQNQDMNKHIYIRWKKINQDNWITWSYINICHTKEEAESLTLSKKMERFEKKERFEITYHRFGRC